MSPKRFLQFLTLEHAKQQLLDSKALLEATWEAGLSSPGRLHDLFVSAEAATPGEFKTRGAGIEISYLIPCHRVIRESGLLGGYRWGEDRKRAILGWEASRAAA